MKKTDYPIIENTFTCHKLMGQSIDDEKKTSVEIPKGSVVVFDEIYLNSVKMLGQIWQYMKSRPDLTFLATGDVYQLPPVENSLNCLGGTHNDPDEIDNYYRRAIAMMFPNRIVLKEIKRLSDQSQIEKIHKLWSMLFETEMKFEEIIEALQFKCVSFKETSQKCVCHFSDKSFKYSTEEIILKSSA